MDSSVARWVPSDNRTRLAVVLLVLAALLATTGLALSRDDAAGGGSTPPPAAVAEPMDTESGTTLERAPRVPRQEKRSTGAPQGPPSELVVPALGVQAPVVPIEMDTAGVLTPPADVNTVGWWQRSAEPGSGDGQTLITGHTVRVGDGAMDRIGELGSGARVEVRADGGTAAYRVTDVVTYERDEVAAQAQELFGQDRTDGRLVLVTCTDWNGSDYESNIIVHGKPVAVERAASAA